jgi:hypothetical protein
VIGLRMWLYFGRGGRGRLGGGPGQGGSCDGRWAGILIVVRGCSKKSKLMKPIVFRGTVRLYRMLTVCFVPNMEMFLRIFRRSSGLSRNLIAVGW